MKSLPKDVENMCVAGERKSVAVVIPCYRVRKHILEVIGSIGSEVDVNLCGGLMPGPQQTGEYVAQECGDPKSARAFP